MNGKILGAILGVAGMFLWFMPLVIVNFMGTNFHQAGNHIGGIAYLLLFASMAYAVLSWIGQHVPRIIASSVTLAISILFLAEAGSSAAWGLFGLILVGIAGIVAAVRDNKIKNVAAN